MKIKARQNLPLGRRARLLLCLTLGLAIFAASSSFPPALAATGSRSTVTQAVTQENLPGLALKPAAAAESLQAFTRVIIGQLSADAPFQEWKNAGTEIFPLGPGTHSWLVNVMNGEQRIGYLIISAAEDGGYLLSEYGAGTEGLPYSMSDLRQYLVQEGLLPSNYSGVIGLSALYAPLLPVWKLTIENKTLYLNASVLQVLPWSLSQADSILSRQLDAKALLPAGTDQQARKPAPALLSGGQDDPYADLLWLTAPKLTAVSGPGLAALLAGRGSIAFQAAGHNGDLGSPFMITGCQSWLPASGGSQKSSAAAVVYAAAGPGGKRYLPLAALQQYGSFHKPPLPLSGGTTLGAAPASKP
ncbi:hypothetical protein [Paenibacillus sp. MMS20-IR301]|uniref:hypothetical protein n=1 Tax=Paenibacillus sp. MMS20-IR301 TaxID=2895946 RepID=UPI0028EAAD9A|nr:hypothetical protein [Paenibacillus sp. MMS20-IR301]WNS46116.1 hypothetical protein LOS79_12850 [Paenibacillus sp. MMS20-IR301]